MKTTNKKPEMWGFKKVGKRPVGWRGQWDDGCVGAVHSLMFDSAAILKAKYPGNFKCLQKHYDAHLKILDDEQRRERLNLYDSSEKRWRSFKPGIVANLTLKDVDLAVDEARRAEKDSDLVAYYTVVKIDPGSRTITIKPTGEIRRCPKS